MKTVILAAGEGRRMKSDKPKVLHEILGKSLIQYSIELAEQAGSEETILVVGHEASQIREHVGDRVKYALQQEQKGTGHAVKSAMDYLQGDGDVLVLYGDMPLVRPETIQQLMKCHHTEKNGATLVTVMTDGPSDFGRMIRENGRFVGIVEARDCTEEQRQIREINPGIYLFQEKVLVEALNRLQNNNVQQEYYLPDTVAIILDMGFTVNTCMANELGEFLGVNTRWQLADAVAAMKARINRRHMEQGVEMLDPAQTYIGPEVEIMADTTLYPGTILMGRTSIGKNCVIGPGSRIVNSSIGRGTKVENSTVLDSEIGEGTSVGPYAYVRPHSKVGSGCKVGDFVEIKNAVIGNNTKASHLTYIGDADVGEGVNFGCGTVTVNYDGDSKYRTTVKDHSFIGCNTNLIAPVTVEEGAYIAAGSTITDDVPEKALGIARARQLNKLSWRKKER